MLMSRALRLGFPIAVVMGLLLLTALGNAALMAGVSLAALIAAAFVFRDELAQMGPRWAIVAGVAALLAASIAVAITALPAH